MMTDEEYIAKYGKTRKELLDETTKAMREAHKNGDKSKMKELAEFFKRVFIGDDVDWANEVSSNFFLAAVMAVLTVLMGITLILGLTGVYHFHNDSGLISHVAVCIVQLLIGIVIHVVTHGEKPWVKYVQMLILCLSLASVHTVFGYSAEVSLIVPVLLSTKYLSEKFTKTVCAFSGILMVVSSILTVYMSVAYDLNTVAFVTPLTLNIQTDLPSAVIGAAVDWKQYLANQMTLSFLPLFMQFMLVSWICNTIAKWGHRTLKAQAQVTEEFTRVDTELGMAKDIQTHILPNIFPAFPDRPELDIFATMNAAREVGGDFYDFFLVDDDHVCLVIADVSGKGMPAALFMMIGKSLIKNQAQQGKTPADLLAAVNNQLCDGNETGLFITAWVGILELSTGKLTAANAGHEYPFLKRKDGEYEVVKDKHGFVLGGMEDSRYKEYELMLEPGDRLFVYTDGVTEATNAEIRQFGMENLQNALNNADQSSQQAILTGVHEAVNTFVGEAPQFDDLTMLGVTFVAKSEGGL